MSEHAFKSTVRVLIQVHVGDVVACFVSQFNKSALLEAIFVDSVKLESVFSLINKPLSFILLYVALYEPFKCYVLQPEGL